MGLSFGLVTGDLGQVAGLLGAALVHVPAVWVLVGVAVSLFGLVPRAASAAWVGLAVGTLIGFLGRLLGAPGWVIDLSPFQHVPPLPAAELTAVPLVVLTAVAAGLVVLGVAGFARRDVG